MPADAADLRSHQSSVFYRTGGVGAKVFGVVGKAEAELFDGFGGEGVGLAGVGNWRLMEVLPARVLSRSFFGARAIVKSSKYIPKWLLKRVQQMEQQKAAVREILGVLGVTK